MDGGWWGGGVVGLDRVTVFLAICLSRLDAGVGRSG